MAPEKKNILIIGGGFAGFVVARHMRKHFNVTMIDAKEYFEYTPGILRAFVHPSHLSALTFKYQPVLEGSMGCRFVWGEVLSIDEKARTATYKPIEDAQQQTLSFDYCVIASGCNFGLFHKKGESLWFPTVWEQARAESDWKQHDERYLQGRRDHIQEEYNYLKGLNSKSGSVLIVGAGFIGVEWATEIDEYFPNIKITLCDMLPKCLGPLPDNAKDYCQKYMDAKGIVCKYGVKFNPNDPEGYKVLGIERPDKTYISTGFKSSCWFMPQEVMSQYNPLEADKIEKDIKKKGPAGGGWITVDKYLRVTKKNARGEAEVFGADAQGHGRFFAVGDCNMVDGIPCPKISYPGEEQAAVACRQIEMTERMLSGSTSGCYTVPKQWPCLPMYGTLGLTESWFPWGSGMFATSLGSKDACFVIAATMTPGSGYMVVWGYLCAWQKWFIEWSKVDQCKEGWIGWATWMMVH